MNQNFIQNTDKLIGLKKHQQNIVITNIAALKCEKEKLMKEIRQLDEELENHLRERSEYRHNFYLELLNQTFSNKEFLTLDIFMQKSDAYQAETIESKEDLQNDLSDIDQQILELKARLKELIVKEEKFLHILANINTIMH